MAKKKKKIQIKKVMDGSVLVSEGMMKHLPYIMFLVLLAILYIANRFSSESAIRNINKLQTEIKDLNSESVATSSELMNNSKQSEVIKAIELRGMGLKESTTPPTKVVIESSDLSDFE